MRYSVKVLTNAQYDKLAEKYPAKSRARIKDSWGFTDVKKKQAFVRNRHSKVAMLGVAAHEMMELLAKVSPHEEDGLRFKGKSEAPHIEYTQPPAPTYSMSPEDKWLYENISKPYAESQFKNYQDVFNPLVKQLGGSISNDLQNPMSLPEDEWSKIWQKTRERNSAEYAPIERQTSQRLAATGALDSSGQSQKAFRDIDLSKAKSIEDLAIQQALAEYNDKKAAKQSAYDNAFRFSGGAPAFQQPNSTATEAQPYLTGGKPKTLNWWESLGSSINPFYHDVLAGQGYPAQGLGTADYAKLFLGAGGNIGGSTSSSSGYN